MRHVAMNLATFTLPDEFHSVSLRGGPVEPLPHDFERKVLAPNVRAAQSQVHFGQRLVGFLWREAFQEGSGVSSPVQSSV
ncbi:hypothetical protein Nepgr_020275 [Nepenthes gracilis]|uniref:Uncharacterized protein n=1 Tax=Nepenthes gracilis TaxID=150966 RepID=A0AAD3XVW6_NEPGR|nr:hypothetical protein Nepgr_020275 [Nepenthes gracilis]